MKSQKNRILKIVAVLEQKKVKLNFKNIMLFSLTTAGGTITDENLVKTVLIEKNKTMKNFIQNLEKKLEQF